MGYFGADTLLRSGLMKMLSLWRVGFGSPRKVKRRLLELFNLELSNPRELHILYDGVYESSDHLQKLSL